MRLVDGVGRPIDYLRLSVTDRCDFRCVYCMAKNMTFLPRQQVLTLEELQRLAALFVGQGVRKIRLTGGEPLIRPGIVGLCRNIAALPGLRELVMTSNGSQLRRLAQPLAAAGVKRMNISLDSLDPERFRAITRNGDLRQVLDGIEAAREAGFERVKLNCVVMKGRNFDEVPALVRYAIEQGIDISFIEEMPLGDVGRSRGETFCPSDEVRAVIAREYELLDSAESSGGPARYVVRTDVETNTVYVTADRMSPALFTRELVLGDCRWIAGEPPAAVSFTVLAPRADATTLARLAADLRGIAGHVATGLGLPPAALGSPSTAVRPSTLGGAA